MATKIDWASPPEAAPCRVEIKDGRVRLFEHWGSSDGDPQLMLQVVREKEHLFFASSCGSAIWKAAGSFKAAACRIPSSRTRRCIRQLFGLKGLTRHDLDQVRVLVPDDCEVVFS